MRQLAIFTITQNETRHLPNWLNANIERCPPHDLYVLDHQTTGDAADALVDACQGAGVENVIPVTHEQSYDSQWLTLLTRNFQQFLLGSYKNVLFTAVDEIVLPRERHWTNYLTALGDYGSKTPTAFEIVHDKDTEPAINWGERLVSQRTKCCLSKWYSKPLLAQFPLYWHAGWTRASNVPASTEPDPDLALLHLHRIDYDECLRSHREKSARTWKPEERKEGVFRHNMIEEPEMLSRWLLSNSDNTAEYAKLVEIPSEFKEFC